MNRAKLLALLAAAGIAFGTVAQASPVNLNVDVTDVSHYYWRGYNILNGAKFPVQPSITASMDNGLSANVWGSWALSDRGVYNSADELDFTVSYSRPVTSAVGVSLGAVYYYLPNNTSAKTSEMYAAASFSNVLFAPSVTLYYDTRWLDDSAAKADGWYVLAAGSHTVPIGRIGLDLGAGLGFGSNSNFDGLQDLTLRAATTLPVGPVKVTPFITPVVVFEDKVNSETFNLAGGVTVSYEF